jgi:hypothetical protein
MGAVLASLEQVLSSHLFRGSRRCQILLRRITEQTLEGDARSLKERTLGVEVFGRSPDYDTSLDPVVRATASEIRKKLAQYYQEPGHESEARIELVSGSYIAEFHFNGEGPTPTRRRRKRYVILAASLAVPALLVLTGALVLSNHRRSNLEELWAPVLQAPGSTLISVGQPIVYNLRSIQDQDAIQGIGAPEAPGQPSPDDVIPRKDLLILPNRYVVLGDAVCLARLATLFERYKKSYRIRGERSTSFADLSEGPAVLIGAFNNQWTLRAAGQLRFTFVKDYARGIDMVRDQQHPQNTEWRLAKVWPYWDVPNDYAIVSRILDTTTDRPVVIAAGITGHGTMVAGEFLTNAEYFSETVPQLPHGWQKKNLQIVLRVPVVKSVAGHPRVLATHVW